MSHLSHLSRGFTCARAIGTRNSRQTPNASGFAYGRRHDDGDDNVAAQSPPAARRAPTSRQSVASGASLRSRRARAQFSRRRRRRRRQMGAISTYAAVTLVAQPPRGRPKHSIGRAECIYHRRRRPEVGRSSPPPPPPPASSPVSVSVLVARFRSSVAIFSMMGKIWRHRPQRRARRRQRRGANRK